MTRLLGLMLCLATLLANISHAAEIPDVTDANVEQALTLAGANRGELETAQREGIQRPFTMQALRFLIVSSPAADLGKLTAVELVEHVELALLARGEAHFGGHYDDAIWAHYVLPPRVSQEPLSAWRPYFYEQLKEVVAGALTIEDAAVAVNRWCGERVVFKQTQSRDQGPLSTLAGGYGRCEELCILLIDACRAVGIPARMAYCPWWAVSDNNHAWVEIYGSDGRWHFTGACEPAPTLDDAWFSGAARSAPIILSPQFGLPGPDEALDDVMEVQTDIGARFCRINTTRFYRETGWLEVEVPQLISALLFGSSGGAGSGAAPNMERTTRPEGPLGHLNVHVFNYGALRTIARLPLDASAMCRVELGAGDYVLTTEAPGGTSEQGVTVRAGETTRLLWPNYIRGEPSTDSFILHFPAE